MQADYACILHYCIVKPPVLLGVEKLIAMDKNLLAHYNKSRFADRN